jgi:hypothetical protein
LSNPYPLQENNEYAYEFVTDQGIEYLAYFMEYGEHFVEYPELAPFIYTFDIEVRGGDADEVVEDERIGETVWSIFQNFFAGVQNAVIYVCDNLDGRHRARKKKFDWWFFKYNDGTIIKENGLISQDDMEIFNSLLVHKDHTHLREIINAFKELNNDLNTKKEEN